MHSFHHNSGVNIHHNGDFSGDAKIVIPASIINGRALSEVITFDGEGNLWIEDLIPAGTIADFGFEATINRVISVLEQLQPERFDDPNPKLRATLEKPSPFGDSGQ